MERDSLLARRELSRAGPSLELPDKHAAYVLRICFEHVPRAETLTGKRRCLREAR